MVRKNGRNTTQVLKQSFPAQ